MVLESCMILLDNSEYMRNGDYVPTRLEAQHDAANFLVGTKTRSNPENTVGVIAMCGSASGAGELLVSPTDDVGKILTALHGIPIRSGYQEEKKEGSAAGGGGVDIVVSLQVANLALKHRRNKNGAQRVVVFVGSPLSHVDGRAMAKAGRMLKKNNLAIDIIAMGELEENEPKLKELVDAANGTDASADRTCHLVTIPAGVLPSDVLVSSPIVHGGDLGVGGAGASAGVEGMGAGGGGGGTGFPEFGGVDPNMDPELAMALRVSMEEERARQERATAAAAPAAAENINQQTTMEVDQPGNAEQAEIELSEEDALLQQALAMSMDTEPSTTNTTDKAGTAVEASAATSDNKEDTLMEEDDDEDEDAAMQLALQMSMQPDSEVEEATKRPATKNAGADAKTKGTQQFQDPQFVNQLLGSLPGVDTNDPELNSTIQNLLNKKDKGDDSDKDDKKDSK